jgi:hypothetical protein
MQTAARRPQPAPQWPAAVIGFIVGMIVLVMLLSVTTADESAGAIMGRVVGALLLTGLAMLFVLRASPLWFRLGWLAVYVLFVLGLTTLSVAIRERIRDERMLAQALHSAQQEMHRATLAAREGRQTPLSKRLEAPEPGDSHALAAYLMQSVVRERIENRNRYLADIDAIGWDRLLEAEDLRRRDARALVNARVAGARKAVDDWIARERATTQKVLREMRRTELPSAFRKGFETSLAGTDIDRRFEDVADSERGLIDGGAALAEVLLRERWVEEGDEILFETERGLEAFRRAQAELQARAQAADRSARESLRSLEEDMSAAPRGGR